MSSIYSGPGAHLVRTHLKTNIVCVLPKHWKARGWWSLNKFGVPVIKRQDDLDDLPILHQGRTATSTTYTPERLKGTPGISNHPFSRCELLVSGRVVIVLEQLKTVLFHSSSSNPLPNEIPLFEFTGNAPFLHPQKQLVSQWVQPFNRFFPWRTHQ